MSYMLKKNDIVLWVGRRKAIVLATKEEPSSKYGTPPKGFDYLIGIYEKDSNSWHEIRACYESQLKLYDDVKGVSVTELL